LLESGMDHKKFMTFFLAFSLASPFGAMLACIVQLEGSSTVLSGVVTGLASGSFMYIGFMEMLPAMLSSCQNMADAMALFIFSAVAMAALAAVV
jgi:zinc transporter ZupT